MPEKAAYLVAERINYDAREAAATAAQISASLAGEHGRFGLRCGGKTAHLAAALCWRGEQRRHRALRLLSLALSEIT